MTIIVSYQQKNYIFLVGDLLLSGLEHEDQIQLPTRFNSNQPVPPRHLTGLCQKLVCVNDNLAVAWAGSKIVAQHLIRRIANELSAPFSSEEILSLIYGSGLSDSELDSVSFIFYGAYRDEKTGDIHQFVQDYLTGETIIDKSSKVKYSGSGQFHFLECMDFQIRGSTGTVTEYEGCIAWLMSRMALALFKEMISEDTHIFSYGGGFEIVCLDPTARIAKIPTTFVFWRFDGTTLELVGPVLSFNYPDPNILLINRLIQLQGSSKWDLSQFVVNDLLGAPTLDPDQEEPNFDTFFAVHYLLPTTDSESIQILIKKGSDKSVKLRFASGSGTLQVDVNDQFRHEVEMTTKRVS